MQRQLYFALTPPLPSLFFRAKSAWCFDLSSFVFVAQFLNITYMNIYLFVCLSVCLSVLSVPSRPVPEKKSLKQKILLKKVVRYTSRVTKNSQSLAAVLGDAKPSYVYSILKPHFRISSPSQSRFQAVVCVSTPRKYPQSGYFLVLYRPWLARPIHFWLKSWWF